MKAERRQGLFANRFVQTILLSNLLLQIGIWVRNFAVLMYVTEKTNEDPVAVSLILVAEFAPIFIFSFIGGVFADRWRPKRTMIWCDMLSAVSVFVVLLTMVLEAWQAVYFATFVSAILSQFSQPSALRMFKTHVPPEQLQQAMAFFQSMVAIFMVAGPSLGVYAYNTYGIEISIAIMGVAFLLSAAVLFRLPEIPEQPVEQASDQVQPGQTQARGRLRGELAEGFSYVWRSPVLKVLALSFALAGLSVGIAQTLSIFVVTENLNKPKEFLQFMLMINGIAMLVGGGVIAAAAKKIPPQRMLAAGMLVSALCITGTGFSTSVPLTLTLQFFSGLAFPAIQIAISTMVIQWSDDSIVGRVNGVMSPMFVGMMVIMMSAAGLMKREIPLVTIYTISGTLMLLGSISLLPLFKHKPPVKEEASAAAVLSPH
ncbi:MFS transporter [Paenibacillus tarimensis]|uniref:MFS transporter n=1 Tax=Paenibacillus tarimensis TaxID=416012 RepID=UPI0038B32FDC